MRDHDRIYHDESIVDRYRAFGPGAVAAVVLRGVAMGAVLGGISGTVLLLNRVFSESPVPPGRAVNFLLMLVGLGWLAGAAYAATWTEVVFEHTGRLLVTRTPRRHVTVAPEHIQEVRVTPKPRGRYLIEFTYALPGRPHQSVTERVVIRGKTTSGAVLEDILRLYADHLVDAAALNPPVPNAGQL